MFLTHLHSLSLCRKGNDITPIYGEKLVPIILEFVKTSQCILDGELLIWDRILERFEEFGKLKTFGNLILWPLTFWSSLSCCHSLNWSLFFWQQTLRVLIIFLWRVLSKMILVQITANNFVVHCSLLLFAIDWIVSFLSITENEILHFFSSMYCLDIAFDILFVNGQSVMDLTLHQRVALLKRCIPNTQPKVFELAEQRIAKTTQDVIEALDTAILNRFIHTNIFHWNPI